ncbi:MAG: hypothetical protein AAF289_01220 [Cyanobacteria bacterium P01_A01_bin.135]
MADVKLIRAALAQQGSRLQKLPRQAIWLIHHHDGQSYHLTYQRAPLSGWAIHPPDGDASRILGIIDRALTSPGADIRLSQPTTYRQQLHPWCIVQLLPQMQRRVIARFRRRNDADAHMRVLHQHCPLAQYIIVFDPSSAKANSEISV